MPDSPPQRSEAEDVTRQAENVFAEGLGTFVQFLEELPVGVFIIEANGKPFYANSTARALTQPVNPNIELGEYAQAYSAYVAGTDELYPEERMPMVRALRGERSTVDDMEIHHPDRRIPLEVSGAPIYDAKGAVAYAITAFSDISERKAAEGEIARALEAEREASRRLSELDRLRNDFVAMIAHDMRTPMSIVTGFADTLVMNWDSFSDEDKRDFLGRISAATMHLASLIDDIFEVARIESGQLKCEIVPFDLDGLVRRTVAERADSHNDRTYQLRADALPQALGDEHRQWQILSNLLTNAVKFSPPDQPIEVEAHVEGPFVRISVTDHGPGIDPAERAKLFQKFSRLTSTGGVKGTGLGLFICRSLVEAQGGTISVESEPGHGATFSYTVPIA
jgi:signal transduction histidine kinase